MRALQSIVTEQADSFKAIGEGGCLAFCYAYVADAAMHIVRPEADFIMRITQAHHEGIIDKQCNVYNAAKFLQWWSGKQFDVTKAGITGGDISHIIEPTPVRYLAKGHGGHFVVVANGHIAWNPLLWSFNVEHGIPIEARIVTEV